MEKNKVKCHQYWPEKLKYKKFKKFNVEFVSENELEEAYVVERKFVIKREKADNFEVTHLHYKAWPDHGVPEVDKTFNYFHTMFQYVKNIYNLPVLVHCSAGIGRTGTFISSFILWTQLTNRFKYLKELNQNKEVNKVDFNFSIFRTVLHAKESRCNSVENPKQYEFIYNLSRRILKALK